MASIADGLDGKPNARREEAIALLALLAGVSLARAVQDRELSNEIAVAVRKSALRLNSA